VYLGTCRIRSLHVKRLCFALGVPSPAVYLTYRIAGGVNLARLPYERFRTADFSAKMAGKPAFAIPFSRKFWR